MLPQNSLTVSWPAYQAAFGFGLVYMTMALPKVVLGHSATASTALVSAGIASVLIALSVIDMRSCRLPDVLTIPLVVAGIVISDTLGWDDWSARTMAAAVGFVILYATRVLYFRWRNHHGLGLGDAKLFAAAGAWTGIAGLPAVMLWACGTALAFVFLWKSRGTVISSSTALPFGPFLAIGIWAVWLYGSPA